MHYWTEEETAYLKSLLGTGSFSEIAAKFKERFPDREWSRRMIAGRTNRLGLCSKSSLITLREPKDPIRPKLPAPEFHPIDRTLLVAKPEVKVPAVVEGAKCKWPMWNATCNNPAGEDGYCCEHGEYIRKCARQASRTSNTTL